MFLWEKTMEMIAQMPKGMNPVNWLFDPSNPDRLPDKARDLLELLDRLAQRRGYAYVREFVLADYLEISISYVEKLVGRLHKAGAIYIKKRRHNFYWIKQKLSNVAARMRNDKPATARQPATKDEAQLQQGANTPAPSLSETEIAARLAEIQQMEEALKAEPVIEPEIKQAVEDAAKEVKKDVRNVKPKSQHDYIHALRQKLAAWQIEAPGCVINEVVKSLWSTWW
jgi:biotin operon repressor